MKKNKYIKVFIINIFIFIIAIGIIMIKSLSNKDFRISSMQGKEKKYTNINLESATSKELVQDMGIGWNYGGEFAGFSGLKKDKYQLLLAYSSNPYTAWDEEGSYPYFNSNTGKISISWTMSSLKSSGPVGAFSIQLVNQQITDSGNTKVKYQIENTQLVLKDGTNIEIGGEGIYSSTLNTHTDTQSIDLTSISGISDTTELEGATISMDVSIIDYAVQKTTKTEKTINPVIFDAVKSAGFNTVRLPVTFIDYMDSEGNIDADYLEQIKTVIDYITSRGMYCIIDVHHDAGNAGWLSVGYVEEHKAKFQNMWKQIASKFASYDYHLVFEGVNEPLNFLQSNMWDVYDTNNIPEDSILNVNKLNQYFVDAVRSVSGNENRFLMVSSYANKEFSYTNTYKNGAKFQLPNDSATDKLIIDAHIYTSSSSDMDWRINLLKSSGYTAYIGEFGIYSSQISSAKDSQIYLVQAASKEGIQCAVWDDGQSMAVLKASSVTDSNYTSTEIWYGSEENYVPDLVAASKTTDDTIKVTGVTLNKTETSIEKGNTEKLIATIEPENASDTSKTWSSDNEQVATVNNGEVTAKGVGVANITVTTNDGSKTATCKVNVIESTTEISPESITLNKQNETLDLNGTKEINLVVTIEPSNANINREITWTTSKDSVAIVSEEGKVTAIGEGEADITATTKNGKTATCKIKVVKIQENANIDNSGNSSTNNNSIEKDINQNKNINEDQISNIQNKAKDNSNISKTAYPKAGKNIKIILIIIILLFGGIFSVVRYCILNKNIKF